MKVVTTQPFQVIYSLLNHEYLGYLFEVFVVQLDDKERLTLLNQNISSKNVNEFSEKLDDDDFILVKLIDAIQQEVIVQKFSGSKKRSVAEFFLKVYDSAKGDKTLQEKIGNYLEEMRAKILPLLLRKQLFVMGGDGNPIWKKTEILPEKATILFHFVRNPDNTHYFPTMKYQGQKVDFQYKNAFTVCNEPAWLMLDNKLYHFEKEVDGNKIRPFLSKRFIIIPKKIEEDYYRIFVTAIITMFDVYAKGFEIRSVAHKCVPILSFTEQPIKNKVLINETEDSDNQIDTEVFLKLSFQYGIFVFQFDGLSTKNNVSMEKQGDDYIFHKVRRDLYTEKRTLATLDQLGINLQNGLMVLAKKEAFSWLQNHYQALMDAGFQIDQKEQANGKRYFLGYSQIEVKITESNDWFDIHTLVRFGQFEIPFIKLRSYILNKKREFILPNGEVAVIPEAWFIQYSELFAFVEQNSDNEGFVLKKYHISLVQDLEKDSLATAVISKKLDKLRDFEGMQQYALPKRFMGTLRPYQKAGYEWMRFLNDYHFGGCLADDMGLGKTVQTLALLQSEEENKQAKNRPPSLLIMPTSLIYNWEMEAKKFTPDLKVLVYTGTNRDKNTELFNDYDLVLTSYGIIRIDIDLLKNYRFHYLILDESQAIKNPNSYISKAVTQLSAKNRLILTGTPLENSTLDLWSQMNFVNPGLLGSQVFFRNEFQIPIEKKNDEKKVKRLFSIIKPFMLRRHKSQVAKELPPKIESIQYCQMTEQQEHEYEEAKSFYRNLILKSIENDGIAKSQMVVLQGLTKLRQIANHPKMTDVDYEGDSGKLGDVIQRMKTALGEGHKILIFSQFVKHLDLFRERLDADNLRYAYLDGSTTDRQAQVELFQKNENIKIFLISLKAGGLGLNLTAADYVFILDPWWNPAIEAQAIDRAHRIGQDKTVFTYKFITKNSVEEKILSLQKRKQRLANELVTTEDSFVKSLSRDDVLALLE